MVLVARGAKAFSSPVQRPAKVQEPQLNDSVKKCLEATSLGQKQLSGIEGPDGFLNPKIGLLMSVIEFPGSWPRAQSELGETGFQLTPMPARQFISGGLGLGLLREQEQHLIGRVRQIQEPAFFRQCSHE